MTNQTTRRAVLAGSAGAATAALPLPATAAPDPIFAAIAQHRRAEDQLEQTLNASSSDVDRQTYRRLRRPVDRAALALTSTVPTTAAGLAALLWYVHENQRAGLSLCCETVLGGLRKRASAALGAAA